MGIAVFIHSAALFFPRCSLLSLEQMSLSSVWTGLQPTLLMMTISNSLASYVGKRWEPWSWGTRVRSGWHFIGSLHDPAWSSAFSNYLLEMFSSFYNFFPVSLMILWTGLVAEYALFVFHFCPVCSYPRSQYSIIWYSTFSYWSFRLAYNQGVFPPSLNFFGNLKKIAIVEMVFICTWKKKSEFSRNNKIYSRNSTF